MLWLSEPDNSQHRNGPGSRSSLKAIASSDKNLARVLEALQKKGVKDQTDVIVVSDHGFSTISRKIDVAAVLNQNGFHAIRKCFPKGLQNGEVLVAGNGGSVFLYVAEHDQNLVERIVHQLQAQPFAGVILTREPVEGAFPLDEVRINSADAPDIVLSLRWTPDLSRKRCPGMLVTDTTTYSRGKGMHASLSRFDMHNTCIAAGPDFRRSFEDHIPTGNIDIAPTTLWILGVAPSGGLSGRVLNEALAPSDTAAPSVESHRLEAHYEGKGFSWHQYLNFSEVNGVRYLDEGNGEQNIKNR
jgi:arylsulfatase A-like enzyme